MNTNTAVNHLPKTATLKDRYEMLQKQMPCEHTTVLVNLASQASFGQVEENYVGALEHLNAYITNGHTTKGLPFSYTSVRVY